MAVYRNPDGTVKPGSVLSPNGSQGAKTPISDSLKVILSRPLDDPLDDVPLTTAQAIALQWARKARAGELEAIKSLTDRVEGKPKEAVDHSGDVHYHVTTGVPKRGDDK